MKLKLNLKAIVLHAMVAAALVVAPLSNSFGQSNSSSQSNAPAATPAAPATGAVPGSQGGMALGGMMELSSLIMQVVDPEEWAMGPAGGAGESTIVPYPNGVWMDAKGHLKRLERGSFSSLPSGAVRQQWRAGSGLRTISLKQLDAALSASQQLGLPAAAQMQHLAGITHIQFVAIDKENRDVLIAGPAGKAAGNENGFLLEDLRTLARLMNANTSPLGCSLDPNNQGILAAQQYLSDPAVVSRLGRAPKLVADQLKAKVGPHTVNIFGIDPTSSTAMALVDADEHMKRVGLGLADTVPKIKTYFDHLDRKGAAPTQSLIRWWFAYNDSAIVVNDQMDLFELPKQTVAVMSEQQWVNAHGDRQATGNVDEAADAFAADMTAKLNDLRATHPAYARLQGIFEIGLAVQLAIEASGEPSMKSWFPALCAAPKATQVKQQVPQSVEGVTAWERMKNGTVVAVISGGVKLEPSSVASRSNWKQETSIARSDKLDLAAAAKSTTWWWD